MPWATSRTSAPTSSQTLAISLTKEIFAARKALEANLIISALVTSVSTSSPPSGSYTFATLSRAASSPGSAPITTLSGCRKSRIALPSLRNSGQET
jgi:hypothetical protein